MSRVLFNFIVVILCVLTTQQALSQCNGLEVPAASFTCADAPVLCQIDCLDGFTATLPNVSSGVQPIDLCNGGQPNNMSWFAFVAGSDSINLLITPSSCSTVNEMGVNYEGIQVGIWTGCDFDGDSEPFVCVTTASTSPITLASSDFQIGTTYYLFVDGNVGSVCDYEVDVVFGDQAFEMPEIDTVSNNFDIDFSTDTLCVGASVEVTLDGLDIVDAEYIWMIDPVTDIYPSGVHSVMDSNTVTWEFTQEGNFEISVFARNGCDANDTFSFDVVVDTLVDEYFTDIEVCENCLGSLVLGTSDTTCVIGDLGVLVPSILTEDPNGDGTSGWLGLVNNVVAWGQQVNVVNAEYGCTYNQYVNIDPIPLGAREDVLVYVCDSDFPYDYHGNIIVGPVENQMLTLDNQAANRCDSLVSLTVETYGQYAVIENRDCVGGGLEIAIDLNGYIPPGTIVTHVWELNSTVIADNDGVDSTIIAMSSGFYSVITTLDIGGDICVLPPKSKFIDLNNITPETPSFGSVLTSACDDEMAVVFVDQVGSSMTYSWSLIPPLPYVEGLTSDTIYVDVSGNNGFQYTVNATNDCGTSLDTMQIMSIVDMPSVDIDMISSICQDSIMTLSYIGNADLNNSVFSWDLDGGAVVQSPDINGPGPHEIRFNTSGVKTISLTVTDGPCETEIYSEDVNVIAPLVLPIVSCNSLFEGVEFAIVDLPLGVNYSYEVVSGSYTTETDVDGVITFEGMNINSTLEINISYQTDCGILEDLQSCTSLDCLPLVLDISVEAPNGFCYDADGMDVSLSAIFDGATTEDGTWEGAFISNTGIYDAVAAGIGSNTISYSITNSDGCTYTDSVVVDLFSTPSLSYEIIDEDCDPEAGVTVKITSDIPTIVYLDGVEGADSLFYNVNSGGHLLHVLTTDNCSDELAIDISPQVIVSVDLLGEFSIEEGLESTYSFNSSIETDSILWFVNGEVICTNCMELTFEPDDEDELCIVIYDSSGCDYTSCHYLETYKITKVHFPTAFSPNGDNNNDYFFPISNNPTLPVIRMMVFDRWGNCVYHQENKTMGEEGTSWDGSFNGQMVDVGVYIYTLQYLDEKGVVKTITGDVLVFL